MSILRPGLLDPKEAYKQVDAAYDGVVGLHGGDNAAIGQVPVLHFDTCLLVGWLGEGLNGLAVGHGGYGN